MLATPTGHTHLTVLCDDAEEVFVHETVVEFDNGGMVQLHRGQRFNNNNIFHIYFYMF